MKDISLRFLWYKIRGYQISFPSFPLNSPTSEEYTLANLPTLPYCGLYLGINGPKEKTNVGHWNLTLLGTAGDSLREVSLNTDQMIWASGSRDDFNLYDLDKSFFDPQDKQAYTVRIKFTPSSSNTVGTGALFIRCGGQI